MNRDGFKTRPAREMVIMMRQIEINESIDVLQAIRASRDAGLEIEIALLSHMFNGSSAGCEPTRVECSPRVQGFDAETFTTRTRLEKWQGATVQLKKEDEQQHRVAIIHEHGWYSDHGCFCLDWGGVVVEMGCSNCCRSKKEQRNCELKRPKHASKKASKSHFFLAKWLKRKCWNPMYETRRFATSENTIARSDKTCQQEQ